jgi:hypothetical protein
MAWQKLRLLRSQELVVGGYSPGNPFDALLVGYYNDAGALLLAARMRARFTPASRRQVFRRLGPPIAACPFAKSADGQVRWLDEGVSGEDMKTMKWVEPDLVKCGARANTHAPGSLRRHTARPVPRIEALLRQPCRPVERHFERIVVAVADNRVD